MARTYSVAAHFLEPNEPAAQHRVRHNSTEAYPAVVVQIRAVQLARALFEREALLPVIRERPKAYALVYAVKRAAIVRER